MPEIPAWVYLGGFVAAVAAAFGPTLIRLAQHPAPSKPPFAILPSAPVPEFTKPAPAYDRAGWINDLCVLTTTADAIGQADVATAARSLMAALVAVKEQAK
jgi:hypothetical protein